MVKRRLPSTLADEIADLMDTRPVEPGADELDDDDDDELHAGLLAPEDKGATMPARRIRAAGIDLGSKSAKYAGRVTSRRRLESSRALSNSPAIHRGEEDDEVDEGDADSTSESEEDGEAAIEDEDEDKDDGESIRSDQDED